MTWAGGDGQREVFALQAPKYSLLRFEVASAPDMSVHSGALSLVHLFLMNQKLSFSNQQREFYQGASLRQNRPLIASRRHAAPDMSAQFAALSLQSLTDLAIPAVKSAISTKQDCKTRYSLSTVEEKQNQGDIFKPQHI